MVMFGLNYNRTQPNVLSSTQYRHKFPMLCNTWARKHLVPMLSDSINCELRHNVELCQLVWDTPRL